MLTMVYTIYFPVENNSDGVCRMFEIFSDKRDSERESLEVIFNPGFP